MTVLLQRTANKQYPTEQTRPSPVLPFRGIIAARKRVNYVGVVRTNKVPSHIQEDSESSRSEVPYARHASPCQAGDPSQFRIAPSSLGPQQAAKRYHS